MAKTGMIIRDVKRAKLAKKYSAKREKLRAIISNKATAPEERFLASLQLQELPRNSLPVRQKNRCGVTGRPRGYNRKFGLCRNKLRELASLGQLPGVIKSSW
jgi:small subunit ribosomal protein S14